MVLYSPYTGTIVLQAHPTMLLALWMGIALVSQCDMGAYQGDKDDALLDVYFIRGRLIFQQQGGTLQL